MINYSLPSFHTREERLPLGHCRTFIQMYRILSSQLIKRIQFVSVSTQNTVFAWNPNEAIVSQPKIVSNFKVTII